MQWDYAKLRECFGVELSALIVNTPIHSDSTQDRPELLYAHSGQSITALVYLRGFEERDTKFDWLKKFQLQPRVRIFWWRILRNAIPTNEWLHLRGLHDTGLCPWDCSAVETINHITCSCSRLVSLKHTFQQWGLPFPSYSCIDDAAKSFASVTVDLTANVRLYCTAIYFLWRERNHKKHNRPVATPTVLAAMVMGCLTHTDLFPLKEQWDTTQPAGLSSPFSWCPPPPKWLKFNVDGSLLSNNRGGIGIVIRDSKGALIKAVGRQIRHWDASSVELQAILAVRDYLNPAMLDCTGVIVEGDNSNVIKYIQNCLKRESWSSDCRLTPDFSFLLQFTHILFHFVPRNSNSAANFCAQQALFSPFEWDDITHCHPSLSVLLERDMAIFVDP